VRIIFPNSNNKKEELEENNNHYKLDNNNNNFIINNEHPIHDEESSIAEEENTRVFHGIKNANNNNNYLRQKEEKENFSTPITTILGTSIYSNSKSTVLSYLSIFETLWRQTELLQQLKQADILKTEFINVAAHELRTPTQSIIEYCEMLEAFPEKKRIF